MLLLTAAALTTAWTAVDPQSMRVIELEGRQRLNSFVVERNERVLITDDLELIVDGPIQIDGVLEALQRDSAGKSGIDISIEAKGSIAVFGEIRAGAGANAFDGQTTLSNYDRTGGAGGDIVLIAPHVLVDGQVVAGQGGISGPNARAAGGGNIYVHGSTSSSRFVNTRFLPSEDLRDVLLADGEPGLYGGNGGVHAPWAALDLVLPGGEGGKGGDVIVFPYPDATTPRGFSGLVGPNRVSVDSGLGEFFYQGTPPGGPQATCPDGQAGSHGSNSVGGTGTAGMNGAGGSMAAPAGQPGGTGGAGGRALAGNGGPGGDGGEAYNDGTNYLARGGQGGDGGPGGSAAGGNAGFGGEGGMPNGPGGHPGSPGSATKGTGGAAGSGGIGRGGPANSGMPGSDGNQLAGQTATEGPTGSSCP